MDTLTIVLSDVEEISGSNAKGPWTKFNFKDGNGEIAGSTFSEGVGDIGKTLIGERVLLNLEPARDPKYAPTVKAVKAAPKPEPVSTGPSAAGSGDVDWDAKERRSYHSKAWAQAISASQHTAKSTETAKDIFTRIKPLKDAIYQDIVGDLAFPKELSKADEDIPF